MEYQSTSFTYELITTPWWVSAAICIIGNLLIWVVVPEFIEVGRLGGSIDGVMACRYAAAQSTISKIFNLAMVVFFIFTLFNNQLQHKKHD
ncbi:MAG: hypothetical protein RW306_02835 [Geobacteraceae bacterium]|nr:hypothetical protein [Geobacteraceae bacterium]